MIQALITRIAIAFFVVVGLSLVSWLIAYRSTRPIRAKGLRLGVRIVLQVAMLLVFLVAASNFYVYHGFGYQGDIYRRGDASRPWVAITFDDGPSPEFTPAILRILEEYEVAATFFMVGAHVASYPDIARMVVDAGHEVGNHTYHHVNVPTTTARRLTQELFHTTQIIHETTGAYPQYARPPRGLYDSRFRRLADLLGQSVVLWTLSARDWQVAVSSEQIVRRVVNQVKAGDIILFHDSGALIQHEGANRRATVNALAQVIEGIRAKGLEIVPLSSLLQRAEPAPDDEQIILDHQE